MATFITTTQPTLIEAIRLETEKSVSLNQWHQVTLTYDGSRWASGVKVRGWRTVEVGKDSSG